VRFANFAPGAGSLDTFMAASGAGNSPASLFAQSLAVGVGTPYQNLLPGSYRASVAAPGTTTELAGTPLVLSTGVPVSVFAAGVGLAGTTYGLQLLALQDNLGTPAQGMAALRIVALAPDLGPSDVVLLDASGATPVITRRLAVQLAYTGATAPVMLPAGSYTVALVPTGLNVPLLPGAGTAISIAAGSVYTLVGAGCRYPSTGICAASSTTVALTLLQDR